jgi:glycine C-acetyltransferase
MVMVNDLREITVFLLSIVIYPVIPKGIILLRTSNFTFIISDIDETLCALRHS